MNTISSNTVSFTGHAEKRMQQRHISPRMIDLVLIYGRTIHSRGATYMVVGRKEVDAWAQKGVDLRAAEGLHILLNANGAVITTYRNHDLRKIRPSKRRHSVYH